VRKRDKEGERVRKRDKEGGRERERGRDVEYRCFIFIFLKEWWSPWHLLDI
jgi:hypothetical protein